MLTKIRNAAVTALIALGLVLATTPAHAESQPGDFKARFYGTCSDNYVAFWRVDAADPASFAPDDVEIDVNYHAVKQETMLPGDYDEVHRHFSSGVPKTVQVYVDDVLFAERTFGCGYYRRHHHR